jgi:hypothetical protein
VKKPRRGKMLLSRLLFSSFLIILTLLIFNPSAKAAVTGKIAGVLTDEQTGEPLPGANVIVEGTNLGAACDAEGYYYIIRLQPGNYNVQARMMGYRSVTKTGVRVTSDHTTPLNFELQRTVVEGEGITVQAEREVVKMDLAGSSFSAERTEIEAVPLISDVTQYLNLQAGIDGWSVRGSGLEDTKLMADGLLLVDQRKNEPILMPNLSEIKEISLIKGGFNAEYGNVRAGAINVVTREGSPDKYSGSFELRYTPGYQKHNGLSIYDPENYYNEVYLWNKLDTGLALNVDFFSGDTFGFDTVIRLDSVCWKGPDEVWGDPESPFYDTVKLNEHTGRSWKGWEGEASKLKATPEALRDRFLWRRLIDTRGDSLLPNTESLFSIYSNDSAYIPEWDITIEDGDTTYDLVGFTREPYEIPEDQPRIGSYGDLPDWTLDAGFGGPVPVIGSYLGDMTFYVSYRDHNEAFPLPDSRDYYEESSTSLKLTSRFGDMKLNLRGAYSEVNSLSPWSIGERYGAGIGQVYLRGAFDMLESPGEWSGIYHGSDKIRSDPVNLYNPTSLTPFDITSKMYGLTLQHVLSENTFYDIRLTYLRSDNDASFWYDVPIAMRDTTLIWFADARDSLGNYITADDYMDQYAANNLPYGFLYPEWDGNDNVYTTGRILGVEGTTVLGGAQNCGTFNQSWSNTYDVSLDLTSQINKYNQIKTGINVNYTDFLEYYIINEGFIWAEKGKEDSLGSSYLVKYDAQPILAGAYLQDKIEFEGMFANIGLRLDYADANTEWPTRDSNYIYSPYYNKNLKDELFEQDSIVEDVAAQLKLSPRVGISFPFLENSKLFFNYGHFYSLAPNEYRYKISWGRDIEPLQFIGNPRLDMERTISYEVGFESSIANTYLARVTGYYKDNDNEYAEVGYGRGINYTDIRYTTYENLEYSDTRGFELELRKPHGRFFTGWVIYDFRVRSEGKTGREQNYAIPVDNAREGKNDPEQTEPVPQPVWRAQGTLKTPEDWGLFLGGYKLSLMYSWRAGWYETWNPFGGQAGYDLQNNIQWQDERNLDLSLSKSLSISGTSFTVFMDVHNVFDWQELHQQGFHGDKTKYLKSLHLEMYKNEPYEGSQGFTAPEEGEEPDQVGDLSSDDKPYINDPNREFLWYLDPRYVQFGIRFSF